MSYKIAEYALMNVPASASVNPCSDGMNAPQRVSPEQLPDPWLLDTEGLLSELARIRELALRVPPIRLDQSTASSTPYGTSNIGCDTASICTAKPSGHLHGNTIKN